MFEIKRLNQDNSWYLTWNETSILLDPWLTGTEIDGFRWFNEQWHATPPVAPENVGHHDLILVSQPYSDHCHSETIRLLDSKAALIAVAPAARRLKREIPDRTIDVIPDLSDGMMSFKNLHIAKLSPNRWIDPIYHAVIIASGKDILFYAPHGFELNENQRQLLTPFKTKLLITSFSYFKLPFFLGGMINPGPQQAAKLASQLNTERVFHTHDEQKHARGIVIKLAERMYYRPDQIHLKGFESVTDYRTLEVQ